MTTGEKIILEIGGDAVAALVEMRVIGHVGFVGRVQHTREDAAIQRWFPSAVREEAPKRKTDFLITRFAPATQSPVTANTAECHLLSDIPSSAAAFKIPWDGSKARIPGLEKFP